MLYGIVVLGSFIVQTETEAVTAFVYSINYFRFLWCYRTSYLWYNITKKKTIYN